MRRIWIIVGAVVVVLFLALPLIFNFAVDLLWFDSQHLSSVYTTRLTTQGLVFIIALLIAAAFLLINALVARRFSVPRQMFAGQELNVTAAQFRWLAWAVAIVLGFFFALSASNKWETVLRYLNGTSFGTTDPIFGEDVGFYMFTLPFYEALRGWISALLLITIIAVAAVYLSGTRVAASEGTTVRLPAILGGSEPITLPITFPPAMRVHLSVLAALYLAMFAIGYRLDQFKLLYANHSILYGADYTDVNARLIGNWILLVVASISAIILLLNIRFRTLTLLGGAIGLWILAAILVGGIYPAVVDNFIVKPSQISLEAPYISNNITATRQAFNLANVEVRNNNIQPLSQADVQASPQTITNIRLWDYAPLQQTYNQRQSLETYYEFNDVDIDRYTIANNYRQVMIAPRELNTSGLPAGAQTWVNQKLQYTHGNGAAMSPVNEIGPGGQPNYFLSGVPPTSTVGLSVARPEIYFGERQTDYVIVNTGQPEFDYRTSSGDVRTTYTGTAGVVLDSFWKKLAFSYHFGDGNILLSNYITDQSRIIFNRNIQQRISLVAPFLLLDNDPYIAIINERMYWIQDAYTYSDDYPYSTPFSDPNRRSSLTYNYIRNSVKIVIEAYNGDMTFYAFDPSDPLLQTYRSIFPSLFTDASQISPELRSHMRYPEYIFNVQAEQYRLYHITSPTTFYNQDDAWDIPGVDDSTLKGAGTKLNGQEAGRMEAYYIIMRIPGEEKEEFLLMLPFEPRSKKNMVAWMAAKSDGADYGKIVVITFPRQVQIDGPEQVTARINQDAEISQQRTLLGQRGSNVTLGNLLVIPTGNSLLYVQPFYVQAEQNAQPALYRVIVASGTQVASAANLQGALSSLFQKIAAAGGTGLGSGIDTNPSGTPTAGTPVVGTPVVQPTNPPTVPGTNPDANLPTEQLIVATQRHYDAAQAALALTPPDWVTYGREQAALKADLDILAQRLGLTPTPTK